MQKGKTFESGYIASEEFPEYIEHFLYFPKSSDAEMAAEQLRLRGWSAKVELGADDRDWLVLATQPARGDEDLNDVFPEMEDLAAKFNGIYDGYGRPADDEAISYNSATAPAKNRPKRSDQGAGVVAPKKEAW